MHPCGVAGAVTPGFIPYGGGEHRVTARVAMTKTANGRLGTGDREEEIIPKTSDQDQAGSKRAVAVRRPSTPARSGCKMGRPGEVGRRCEPSERAPR